jgi:hypothetical protein
MKHGALNGLFQSRFDHSRKKVGLAGEVDDGGQDDQSVLGQVDRN